jgi:hypothetical protein
MYLYKFNFFLTSHKFVHTQLKNNNLLKNTIRVIKLVDKIDIKENKKLDFDAIYDNNNEDNKSQQT